MTQQALKPVMWKPTEAECKVILAAAAMEANPSVPKSLLCLEPAVRFNVDDPSIQPNMNWHLVTELEDGDDTDLEEKAEWADFLAGVTLSDLGTALVDFYIGHTSDNPKLAGYGILGNITVYYEEGRIWKIVGTRNPSYEVF
jgi:hypothetical protein